MGVTLITLLEQWVDSFDQSLGKEGKQQGKAVHHTFKQLLVTLEGPKMKECQATYNIWSIDSSNAIIQFTRICASLVGGNIIPHYFSFSFLFYMLYMAYLGMLW